MNLQDMMMLYGVTLGKRRTVNEKKMFLEHLREELKKLGYPVRLQEKQQVPQICNLVAGDLSRAKLVVAVSYDTAAQAFYPHNYYPFRAKRNVREESKTLALQLVLALLLFLAAAILSSVVVRMDGLGRLLWLIVVALVVIGFMALHGRSNPYNFNRNSAAVAVAAHLAELLKGESGVAFVFCDRAVLSYEGYKLLAQELPEGATVLLLDGISKGEQLMLAYTEGCREMAQKLSKQLPQPVRLQYFTKEDASESAFSVFGKGMMLTSGSLEKEELVIRGIGTPADIGLDLPRLEQIRDGILAFVHA
jgi:hypothetical protein